MKRTFRAFNAEVIRKEFFTLSEVDGRELRRAMERYRKDQGIGYEVKNDGAG